MKLFCTIAFVGTMVCPLVGVADSSFDAGKLGHMRGLLDSCSNVAPQEAAQYLLQMKSFTGSASREAVSQAMQTEEYRQEYTSIRSGLRDQMSTMSRDQAAATCAAYLVAP